MFFFLGWPFTVLYKLKAWHATMLQLQRPESCNDWQSCSPRRGMRGDEARKLCAKDGVELQLVQVPTSHGKADLTLYRQNSKQVLLPPMHGPVGCRMTRAALLLQARLADAPDCTALHRTACMHYVHGQALRRCKPRV